MKDFGVFLFAMLLVVMAYCYAWERIIRIEAAATQVIKGDPKGEREFIGESSEFEIDDVPGQFARISYGHGRVISFKPGVINGMEFQPKSDTGRPAVSIWYPGGRHRLDVADEQQGLGFIEFVESHKENETRSGR